MTPSRVDWRYLDHAQLNKPKHKNDDEEEYKEETAAKEAALLVYHLVHASFSRIPGGELQQLKIPVALNATGIFFSFVS